MDRRIYPTKLNPADLMRIEASGENRDILMGILKEIVAIEERLIKIEEKLNKKS